MTDTEITRCAKLSLPVDAERLLEDLRRLESGWQDHFAGYVYEGNWKILPLMAAGGAEGDAVTTWGNDFEPTPYLDASPYFQELLAQFECPLLRVRLHRLEPGARIKIHADSIYDEHPEFARIHIPIVTNPDVEFILAEERLMLEPGHAWFTDVAFPHSVWNGGSQSRVHLVVDCLCNDWLERAMGFELRQSRARNRPLYKELREKYDKIDQRQNRVYRMKKAVRLIFSDPAGFVTALRRHSATARTGRRDSGQSGKS
jgi:hypothetical protein